MWRFATLVAFSLTLPEAARTAIGTPVSLGMAFANDTNSPLTFKTSADCPAPNMVWLAQAQVSPGTVYNGFPMGPSDGTSNVYTTNKSTFVANFYSPNFTVYAAGWTSNGQSGGPPVTNNVNQGLSKNSTITFNFVTGPTIGKMVEAFCVAGTHIGNNEGTMGMGNFGISSGPNIRPSPQNKFGRIIFIMTVVQSGASDTWTESCGYTSLPPVSDGTNVLHVAYTILGNRMLPVNNAPPPYCAKNNILRFWTTNFMPYFVQPCGLTTAGAGSC